VTTNVCSVTQASSCSFSSTLMCGTISPPILLKRESRSVMVRKPSSSVMAISPVIYQPSRSTSLVFQVVRDSPASHSARALTEAPAGRAQLGRGCPDPRCALLPRGAGAQFFHASRRPGGNLVAQASPAMMSKGSTYAMRHENVLCAMGCGLLTRLLASSSLCNSLLPKKFARKGIHGRAEVANACRRFF